MNDHDSRRAIVVGAGIGGLTAALALARAGREVTVLERADAFSEVGAGIQLSPNASRILRAFGLGARLRDSAFMPAAIEMRNCKGRQLFARELGVAAEQRFGAPYLNIHRADLHRLLVEAASANGRIELRLAAPVRGIRQDTAGATVELEDGSALTGALVIGADGIRSVVRAALFGPEQPRYTGCVAWRGIVPVAALGLHRPEPVAALWMGPGAHFVHYYVRDGSQLNFVAVIDQAQWQAESWIERGSKDDLVAAFAGWHPAIRAITGAADPEGCYRWGLFDREPMPAWSRGRVTLLGDACHPMLPFMAQGACMAIEDAAVLAECLAMDDDSATALLRYEIARRARTAAIQRRSRLNKTLYHLAGPAAWLRDAGLAKASTALVRQIDRLFAFDAVAAIQDRRP